MSLTAMAIDHGVSVSDLTGAEAFYRNAFAFDRVEDRFELSKHGLRGTVLLNAAGGRIELFAKTGSTARTTPVDPIEAAHLREWFQIAFPTEDVAGMFERVVAAGATVICPPFIAPDGKARVAFVADPEGNVIELIERPA